MSQAQASRLRRYITSFVKYGDPDVARLDGDADFHAYNQNQRAMTFGKGVLNPILDQFYAMQPDTLNYTRCDFWADVPYWNPTEDFKKVLVSQQSQNGARNEMR